MANRPEEKQKASTLALERHMIFVCPECGQTMDTHLDWRQHLNIEHDYGKKKAKDFDFKEIDKKYHECQICLKRLAHAHHSPVILQYHRFSHLNHGGPFRCRYCDGSYSKKRTLSVHLFRSHNQLMNKLDNEYKLAKMRQAIALRHPRFNKEFFIRFICPQCGKLFQRFSDWQEHIDKAHSNTKKNLCMHRIVCSRDYYCDQCSDTLKNGPTWDQLRRHHFSHLPYPNYFQCAFCLAQKSYKTDLFLHYLKHHRIDYLKNKKYICSPEEWGGPPKGLTMKQIHTYSKNDEATVLNVADNNRQDNMRGISNKGDILANEATHSSKKANSYNKPDLELSKFHSHRRQDISSPKLLLYKKQEKVPSQVRPYMKHEIAPTKIHPFSKQKNEPTKTQGIGPRTVSPYLKQQTGPPPVKDILQKALHDSCINLDEELVEGTHNHQQNSQAIPDAYENLFVADVKKTTTNTQLNDNELDLICEEMFEEIPEASHNGHFVSSARFTSIDFKSCKKGLASDNLKSEMQRYINYLCPECMREFDKQPDWRTHVFEQHNLTNAVKSKFRPLNAEKTAYLCLACYQVQRTSKHVDLQRHYFQHMPHQDYLKCTICSKTKSSKPKMLHHLEYVHGVPIQRIASRTLQCLECDQTVVEPHKLQNHLWVCPGRLEPLAVYGRYDNIAKNRMLLKHLQKAGPRLDQMLVEVGVDSHKLQNLL